MGPSGTTIYNFSKKSGYLDEMLAVARSGETPFVARCLKGKAAAQSLAPCERDIQLGDDLSLTFRFPADLLNGLAETRRRRPSAGDIDAQNRPTSS